MAHRKEKDGRYRRVSPDYPHHPQRAVSNTPADRTGACVDYFPVRAAFPTIQFALKKRSLSERAS